jgi:hypothetical protein
MWQDLLRRDAYHIDTVHCRRSYSERTSDVLAGRPGLMEPATDVM